LTPYERKRAREAVACEFRLGYEYSYLNVLLAMTLLYSTGL